MITTRSLHRTVVSLAAASLQDIGLLNTADVFGRVGAWKEEGLPIELESEL